MLRSVFTKALHDRRLSITGWSTGAVLLTLFVVSVYSTLADSGDIQDFIARVPEEMLALFGADAATFLTGAGYLQAQLYSLIGPILIIGLGATAAASVSATEEQTGTMDMQLSMPVSRTSVFLQRSAMVAASLVMVASAIGATIAVTNPIFDLKLSVEGIGAISFGLLGLGLVFAATTLVFGVVTGKPSMSVGLTMLLAVLGWFVNAFSALFTWLEFPAQFSPFTWYLEGDPLINGATSGLAWLGLTTAVLLGGATFLFSRRDLSTERSLFPRLRRRNGAAQEGPGHIPPRMEWLLRSVLPKSVWDRRRSIFGWAGGLGLLLIATFAAWPAMSADPIALQGLVDAIPRDMLAMTGISDPEFLSTAAGFVSSRTYQSIGPVVMIVFTIGAVSALVSKEEQRGVLDVVLSTPRSRRRVLIGKAGAIAVLTALIAAVLAVSAMTANIIWSTDIEIMHILAANTGLAALGLFFGGLALALWSLLPSGGSAIGVTAGVAVAAYLLNGIGSLVDGLASIRTMSPFYWYLGDIPPLSHGPSAGYLVLIVGALATTAFATWRFESRDLAV